MTDAKLTIGQLATYTGATPRAVRLYEERGLLPQPERDRSGYRRYGADAVLALLRIKVLTDAGVPLARIHELIGAEPATQAVLVERIDAQLEEQIAELERRGEQIAGLAGGERMFLEPELADYLDELRDLGVSAEGVRLERDGWTLLFARYPDDAGRWPAHKRTQLGNTEFRRITRAYDEAAGWDASDPRLAELADAMLRYATEHFRDDELTLSSEVDDPTIAAVLEAHLTTASSPALTRAGRAR